MTIDKFAPLSTEKRKRLRDSSFVFPRERKFPIDTIERARNALARIVQTGTPSQIARVRTAVFKKYPSLANGRRKDKNSEMDRTKAIEILAEHVRGFIKRKKKKQ